ncbi:MAG: hypothetical protein LBK25_00435 [Treponema sp.]|nr:hypothetical protein [Treponema sp.]
MPELTPIPAQNRSQFLSRIDPNSYPELTPIPYGRCTKEITVRMVGGSKALLNTPL